VRITSDVELQQVVESSGVEVDRRIVAAVGDVARPRANAVLNRDLGHLPGESGLVHGIRNVLGVMRHGAAVLTEQVQRYGPVYRHMLGPEPAVFVADAGLHAEIARNEDKAWSAALAYRRLFAGVMPGVPALDFVNTFDFALHREVRKALNHAFSPAALSGYFDIAVESYQPAIDQWIKQGRVSLKSEVRRLFAELAGRIFMGMGDPREAERLDRATADVWRSMTVIAKHPLLSYKWRSALRGYRMLHEGLSREVQMRRTQGGRDLFSRLCQAQPDLLDEAGLVRLVVGIMLAAFDTTSMGLASMGYLLAKHQAWQTRLREEALSVPRELEYKHLKALDQHDWAWKETLRLYPVAMGFARVALRDVELAGHHIPARTFISAVVAPVLRDGRYWSSPERFDPERFAPGRAEDDQRGVFMPFGTGAHVCLGMPLANFEAKLFWQMFLSRARIRLARDYEARHQIMPIGSVSGSVDLIVEPL
jgi:cytochrome P450